jgi:two-component system chemotaxis sensor kinase CheA
LDAKHQGGEVWITIRDDGRGLNTEKLLNKAIERGIADATRRYTEREVFDFIFAAGFSTADKITDISGRGVGMDVVRRNVEAVNGRIDVSSELGRGTTFVLRIPLTLAIIEGMLVRVGCSYYTIPLLAIRESVRAQAGDITRLSDGAELLKLRRKHYPIVKLNEVHGQIRERSSALDGILVIVEAGERLACVLVDEVVGQRQTVIKPLPEYLKRVRGVAGCSILHNGDISLILDVEGVVGSVENRAA